MVSATFARAVLGLLGSALLPVMLFAGETKDIPVQGYRLAWGDEFDGSALDTSRWIHRTDSKMWSTQKPENVSVRDGKLILTLKKEHAGEKEYTGAGIISRKAFRHGYYEARLKVPPGAGWHTSFWMMRHDGKGGTGPGSCCQELDVIENDSVNPLAYGVNVHRWNPAPHRSIDNKKISSPDLSADFHTFGCEFTPEHVTYFLDGNVVQTVPATEFPHGDQNIWLTSIASWLGKTKTVDEGRLPATAEFDYVRFYEKTPATDSNPQSPPPTHP